MRIFGWSSHSNLDSCGAKNEKFFEVQKEASRIKSAIVVKYFQAWTRVMVPQVRSKANPRLLYIDLFCGPGMYEDESQSTLLLIFNKQSRSLNLRRPRRSSSPLWATTIVLRTLFARPRPY